MATLQAAILLAGGALPPLLGGLLLALMFPRHVGARHPKRHE